MMDFIPMIGWVEKHTPYSINSDNPTRLFEHMKCLECDWEIKWWYVEDGEMVTPREYVHRGNKHASHSFALGPLKSITLNKEGEDDPSIH